MHPLTKNHLKELTYQFLGACIEVHKQIGPGLLENVYHKCLKQELSIRGIIHESNFQIPLQYKGIDVGVDLRCDFVLEKAMIVELKAVTALLPIHEAQLLTYMKLLEVPKGIMVNFNVTNIINEGIKTFVNEQFRELPS
ncbi:MAG TPA: GxxExxY protein [Saprospirales bacterium]|nr:GxxExxY protein [Saprospirales bacterium]